MSFSDIKASETVPFTDDKKESKEIIIIQLDDQLDDQLTSLAEYTYSLYQKHNRGLIKITTYTDHLDESRIIDLMKLLDKKGLDEGDIIEERKELEVDQAYFTISVTSGPEVQ